MKQINTGSGHTCSIFRKVVLRWVFDDQTGEEPLMGMMRLTGSRLDGWFPGATGMQTLQRLRHKECYFPASSSG